MKCIRSRLLWISDLRPTFLSFFLKNLSFLLKVFFMSHFSPIDLLHPAPALPHALTTLLSVSLGQHINLSLAMYMQDFSERNYSRPSEEALWYAIDTKAPGWILYTFPFSKVTLRLPSPGRFLRSPISTHTSATPRRRKAGETFRKRQAVGLPFPSSLGLQDTAGDEWGRKIKIRGDSSFLPLLP